MKKPTQARVKELLDYDPSTGILIKKHKKNRGPIGSRSKQPYSTVNIDRYHYLSHRIIWLWMTGNWPKDKIDHINHIKTDNRWCNLREATDSLNQKNAPLRKDNTSGMCGVSFHKNEKKWMARIHVDGVSIHLGGFGSKNDAISARKSANIKYGFHKNHGE